MIDRLNIKKTRLSQRRRKVYEGTGQRVNKIFVHVRGTKLPEKSGIFS
jgi:hypothetical protein